MLKSVEKCGMVESIKCSGHVESSQNCDFSRVNSFLDVICEFEQSGLSGMEFNPSNLINLDISSVHSRTLIKNHVCARGAME